MNKLVAFLFALIASQNVFAQSSPVVKLNTGICGQNENALAGSGVVVLIDGTQYVITSDHVVSAMAKTCTTATTASGQKSALTFMRSDWLNGLALLRPTHTLAVTAFTLDQFQTLASGEALVQTVGFPRASADLLQDQARVLMAKSDRSPLAGLKSVIEVTGVHGEFGMSGGALISGSGAFLGILSHLRVDGEVSASSRVTGDSQSSHLIVIPANTVGSWIQSTLHSETSYFVRDSRSQFSPGLQESVFGPGIRLMVQPINYTGQPDRGVLKAKGGDGTGIGGADQTQGAAAGSSISIIITLDNLAKLIEVEPQHPLLKWLSGLHQILIERRSITITGLVHIDESTGTINTVSLQSLEQFMSLVSRGGYYPVISGLEDPSRRATDQRIHELSGLFAAEASVEAADLLSQVNALSTLSTSAPSVFQNANVIKRILDNPAWSQLFGIDFDRAVELRTLIQGSPTNLAPAM